MGTGVIAIDEGGATHNGGCSRKRKMNAVEGIKNVKRKRVLMWGRRCEVGIGGGVGIGALLRTMSVGGR